MVCLYSLASEEWELLKVPRMDALVTAVTTILVKEGVALWGMQECKLETLLKQAFEANALSLQTSICGLYLARARLHWAQSLENLEHGSEVARMELCVAYLVDTWYDLFRVSSKNVASVVIFSGFATGQ